MLSEYVERNQRIPDAESNELTSHHCIASSTHDTNIKSIWAASREKIILGRNLFIWFQIVDVDDF